MSKHQAMLYLGALLGACFLYVALHAMDWSALVAQLWQFRWQFLIPLLAAQLFYFVVKSIRWQFLLRPLAPASALRLLRPVITGIAGNYVIPHAGEFARSLLASRQLRLPISALLATVVIERVFDFLALLAITIVIMLPTGRLSPDIRLACWCVGFLCAAAIAVIVAFLAYKEACFRLAQRFLVNAPHRIRGRMMRQLHAAADGFGAFANSDMLLPIFLLSILQWLSILACVALSMMSVHADVTLGAANSVLLLIAIALVLPAAPGHLGTVQLAFVIGLAPFGVPPTDAIAGSLVYNVVTVAPSLVLGASGLRDAGILLSRRLSA